MTREAGTATGAPQQATFFPLLACNARCPFCSTRVYTADGVVSNDDFQDGTTRKLDTHTYSFEAACAEYRRLHERGVDSINIQGGEPTLFPRLDELITYGKSIGIREQVMVTNGRRLADPEVATRLFDAGLDAIALSIFGSNRDLHDTSLGAAGCFADMVSAVRNLVELGSPEEGPSLTGQLLLHKKNFHDLPDMLRFWYGKGIRVFGIRLLRETANTDRSDGDDWFFDLERLRAPLVRALDIARANPDLRLELGELFHCLIDPEHLPWVLESVAGEQRLHVDHLVAGRNKLRVLNYAESHRPSSTDERLGACDRCDVRQSCVKIEDQYLARFTGELRPFNLEEMVSGLLDRSAAHGLNRLTTLLGRPELLLDAPISDKTARAFLRRLTRALAAGGSPELARTLVGRRTRAEVQKFVARFDVPPVMRLVPLAELDAGPGPIDPSGGPRAVLERLTKHATGPAAEKARFLGSADPLGAERWLVLFGGELPRPDGSGVPYCAAVYDDGCLDSDVIRTMLDELTRPADDGARSRR